jgi:DNA-binding transcriptional LysR family regulator
LKPLLALDMLFDLVDVRLFVNIAEANSLTQGAESSHLSVPSASTRIKNIEDRIGTKLLYRSTHGVSLTPAGQCFLRHARSVLQELEQLWSGLQEFSQGVRGHLRIFASTTSTTEFLPSVLRKYLAEHPLVNVEVREYLSQDIVRAVMDGTTDIGIVADLVRTDGLQVLPYRRYRLLLATPVDHPLANCKAVSFEKTLDFDYVGFAQAGSMHAFLRDAANRLNKRLRTRIEVGNFEALCRMVESNVGIGVVPETAAHRHAKTMKIRLIELSDDWAVRNMQICVRDLAALPAFGRDLIDLLIADAHPGKRHRLDPEQRNPRIWRSG